MVREYLMSEDRKRMTTQKLGKKSETYIQLIKQEINFQELKV